jgi:hypothetical protein
VALVLFDAIPTGWVSNFSAAKHFSVSASVGVKKITIVNAEIFFGPTNQRQRLFFVSQWEQSSDDKNARNKMKKENPPN